MITALGGGVGASKFLVGLRKALGDEHLTAIINTGDDITLHGLRISPDIDTVIYWLSGVVNRKQGWGQQDDTTRTAGALKRFGEQGWFQLGDLDLATHIHRTRQRNDGLTHTEITAGISKSFGIRGATIIPMTDSDVETWVDTVDGEMHFQEYFVREKMRPEVLGITLRGAENARPAPGVIEAILESRGVVICPSNPIISVGTILQIFGIREALRKTSAKVVAVSPIVGGATLKGPADRLMRALGHEVSSLGVAEIYKDFLFAIVIDERDAENVAGIERIGVRAIVADTIMSDDKKSESLAEKVLAVFD